MKKPLLLEKHVATRIGRTKILIVTGIMLFNKSTFWTESTINRAYPTFTSGFLQPIVKLPGKNARLGLLLETRIWSFSSIYGEFKCREDDQNLPESSDHVSCLIFLINNISLGVFLLDKYYPAFICKRYRSQRFYFFSKK